MKGAIDGTSRHIQMKRNYIHYNMNPVLHVLLRISGLMSGWIVAFHLNVQFVVLLTKGYSQYLPGSFQSEFILFCKLFEDLYS